MRAMLTTIGGLTALTAALSLSPAPAHACGDATAAAETTSKEKGILQLSVAAVAAMIKGAQDDGDAVFVYDVNSDRTRREMGVVPGAVMLDSSVRYQVSVLPSDRGAPLIFYCANTMCGASKEAAKRAVRAGYYNVAVMAEGIAGWRKAGLAIEPVRI